MSGRSLLRGWEPRRRSFAARGRFSTLGRDRKPTLTRPAVTGTFRVCVTSLPFSVQRARISYV